LFNLNFFIYVEVVHERNGFMTKLEQLVMLK